MKPKVKLFCRIGIITILCAMVMVPAVAAETDPLGAINNLSDFIFSAIKALGLIFMGLGAVQLGLSFKSHDASQRATAFLTLFGGLLVFFAKELLNIITGG